MNIEHYNELIDLSQKIYEFAADTLTNYCSAKYCGVGNDTTEQQMEDHLIVAEEVSAYLLGNMLAMLTKESQEDEIKLFEQNLRRVIAHQTKKAGERSEGCPGGAFAEGENEVNESIEASSGTKRQQDPLRRPRSRKDIPPS